MHNRLDDLPLAEQCAIYDLRAEGLSFDAIAEKTGCTPLQAARYGGRVDAKRNRPDAVRGTKKAPAVLPQTAK